MEQVANGQASGVDTSASGAITSSAPPAQTASGQTDERVFRQSEVNEIVKRAKSETEDRVKRIYSEQPDYAARKYGDPSPSHISQPQPTFNEEHTRKIAAEEAERLRDKWVQDAQQRAQEQDAQRIVQQFWNKLEPGRQKYQDFDKVTSDIAYAQFPNVVQLLSQHVENAHDILYDLGKDRIKMSNLEYLCTKSPKDAIVQVQRLSESLKQNETASQYRTPNEPLSQMRPSNQGTDNGVLSVKDLRQRYKV